MKIYGIDFTSAPHRLKWITCAECEFENGRLDFRTSPGIRTFEDFQKFLAQAGPWVAGFDFPFGQPAKLIRNLQWDQTWAGYVGSIGTLTKDAWVTLLTDYRSTRPAGDKQHLRAIDVLADSRSPMMLFGVPVGKMFFQGAPRLLKSGVSILPCLPRNDSRIAVEAYPALVARKWIGRQGYKTDTVRKQTALHKAARQKIVDGIRSSCEAFYGFRCTFNDPWATEFVRDPSGDTLDALLCAIQAAWAYTQRERNYGIPVDCDPLEGWIVDPEMYRGH